LLHPETSLSALSRTADPAEAGHSSVHDSNRIIEMLDSKAVRAEKGARVEKHVLITYSARAGADK
jgi:septum formation inhibitor-activating ATPase MinD